MFYEMFNSSEYAHVCFVLENMSCVWEKDHKYSDTNTSTSQDERAEFTRYSKMKKREVGGLSEEEKEKYEKYRAEKSRFTSTGTNETYQECVTDEGRIYYITMCYFYEELMKLGNEDTRRVKLNEMWSEMENKHSLVERINRRNGKRRKQRGETEKGEERLQSKKKRGTKVVLPGQEGRSVYLEEKIRELGGIPSNIVQV